MPLRFAGLAGRYVARTICAGLRGRPTPKPFAYRHLAASPRVSGATALWLWGAVHVLFLIDGRSRAGVEWLWDYLTLRRGTRLITDRPAR